MYLTQGLHRALQSRPNHLATIHGERTRTFREHADRVARLASGLQSLGVRSSDRVAILSLNSDRYVEYLLAVPWAGGVLNPVNIRWSAAEIAYSLVDSGTHVLLIDDAFAPMAPALRDLCPDLRVVLHCGDGPTPDGMISYEQTVEASTPVADTRRGGDDLAGLFYTGGTTGFPKGVMLSHANLMTSSLGSMATGEFLPPGSVCLHAAPMFHLADLSAWNAQNTAGGVHVTVPLFEPKSVLDAIQSWQVTDVLLVPTMIQMLVDHPEVCDYDLSSLQRVMYGGSSIAAGVLRRAMAVLPQARFLQAYGMTELSPVATLLLPDEHVDALLTSAGRAAPHVELEIHDDQDQPVATGVVGEVCVRGSNIMLGYWNKTEESAAALRDDWMHTGDGGYVDEAGYLFVVDRIKDMIVTGGENVYSAEVETVLSKHPAVQASAVIGLPDDRFGERVHACVVRTPGVDVSEAELQNFCKEHIANYKTPRSIDFVGELPLSGAGKVLKRELRSSYAEAEADAVR